MSSTRRNVANVRFSLCRVYAFFIPSELFMGGCDLNLINEFKFIDTNCMAHLACCRCKKRFRYLAVHNQADGGLIWKDGASCLGARVANRLNERLLFSCKCLIINN